ncbi:hypothetical protein Bca52824_038309 [Brassica carinata]|uniref:Protein kinase domain-containing protein n=1 Tax=Brassica carinata TaxID=52824 RepID=A0A8X7RRM5_BRACI|nr:hypothetical protein Bca52824_038309 [Brassica carinata]
MFTPPSKCPPSFSATLIGSVNSMSFKAPIIIASPGGLLGTESGRVSCLRSELHPQTEARYSPCVNAYHVGDFYESPRYLIRSRQEALSNNTSFEYEQTCVTAVGSVSSPFSQLEEMARFCIKHQLMANSQVHLSIFECMVVEMIFSLCNMCYLPTENLLVTSNILKIADFGLASEVASMPPQKCRTSFRYGLEY